MGFPSFSAFPPVPQRSAPEADFDAKMYALFRHFADTHRNELLDFIAFLETNSTVIDGALNATTLGLTSPAAARFTQVEADGLTGAAVQEDPQDATPGRLLRTGAFGLGSDAPARLTDAAVLDVPAGMYSIKAEDGWPFDGALLQLRRNAGRGLQIAARATSSAPNDASEIMVRSSGDSFGGWARLLHLENLLGAVSQDAGVPTGALIERGSNASGEYVRFADGTQICSQQVYHTNTDVTTAAGSLYISDRQTWNFPATFYEPPNVVASGERSNDAMVSGVSIRSAPTVSASTYLFWLSSSAVAGAGSRSAFFIAIGRWF